MVGGLGLGLLSLDDLGSVRWEVGPGMGLQNRPEGQWKEAEEPGWTRQSQGALPSGSSPALLSGAAASSWCLLPLSQPCPAVLYICQPSG